MPHRPGAPVHLSVLRPLRAPRALGVIGHGLDPARCGVTELGSVRLTDPATTWAHLGDLSLPDLVAAGDHFVRRYREGYGRKNVCRPPLATLDELVAVCELGRWPGAAKLRCALALIREDSWSPQESFLRLELVVSGLPEPTLNADIYDRYGVFLACIDLAYEAYRIGVEYQSVMHHQRYAADVERLAALRDEQWDMIEVTSALNGRPGVVADRVRRALLMRGWPGPPRIPDRVR